jgi:BirA family biotin operon repressor/biotin-[acetyl-CoA-carboxylase] ligase
MPGRADSSGGSDASGVRKLAGVLGETEGAGTADVRAVVGIGVNADWPAAQFPPEVADSMTSLREVSGGRPIDSAALLDAFLLRLEPRALALRDGGFDVAGWHARQVTTGRRVSLELPGGETQTVRAVGVDGASGALLVEDTARPGYEREILVGEVVHVRLDPGGVTQ